MPARVSQGVRALYARARKSLHREGLPDAERIVSPLPARAKPSKARRVKITPAEARKLGRSWLQFDEAAGRFESILYFADSKDGWSYAAPLPDELTIPLKRALEDVFRFDVIPLMAQDVDAGRAATP